MKTLLAWSLALFALALTSCNELGQSEFETRNEIITSTWWKYHKYVQNGVEIVPPPAIEVRFTNEGYYFMTIPGNDFVDPRSGPWEFTNDESGILLDKGAWQTVADIVELRRDRFVMRGFQPGPTDGGSPFTLVLVPSSRPLY